MDREGETTYPETSNTASSQEGAAVEEARAFNIQLEQLLAQHPALNEMTPDVARAARSDGSWAFPAPERVLEAIDRFIPGPDGQLRLRTFVPASVSGVYLHLHGGGFVMGGADQQDTLLWQLAQEANVAVVSVDYRLAPEHPYPAAADDCEAAALWLVEHARSEFATTRLTLGGDSAGATLAASTLVRLRDRHQLQDAFDVVNFFYGAFDLSMTPSQRLWGDRNLMLSTPIIRWFYEHYLGDFDEPSLRDPDISPLYADLEGLPDALFAVGTADPLLDDTLFMHARWTAAGNQAKLHVYPQAAHSFLLFPVAHARLANARHAAFLRAD